MCVRACVNYDDDDVMTNLLMFFLFVSFFFLLSLQLYELNDDIGRKAFLDELFDFMQKRGTY